MTTSAITAEQGEQLNRWRAMALQKMGYFSSILFALRPLNNPGSGTFAVDNHWRLYIDFEAVAKFGDLWCAEALLHEAGHLYYQHFDRAADLGIHVNGRFVSEQAGYLSNVAGDAAINDDLAEAGCTTIIKDAILPSALGEPDHETYEHYYRALQSKAKKSPTQPSHGQGQGQPGQGGSGQGGPTFTSKGCGSGAGNLPMVGELPGHDSADGAAPAATDVDKERALISTSVAIEQHAKNRGTVPAGLLAQAQTHLSPSVVPWNRVLASAVRRAAGARPGDQDYTWSKRNRRRNNTVVGPGRRAIFAGTFTPTPKVVVVRDTSGSMSDDDLAMVTSEVEGISRKMGIKGDDLLIMDVDARAYGVREYAGVKTMAEVAGRGGTNMCVGIEAAAAMKPLPNACVVITDGYSPFPEVRIRGMAVVVCVVGAEQDSDVVQAVPDWIRTVAVPTQA